MCFESEKCGAELAGTVSETRNVEVSLPSLGATGSLSTSDDDLSTAGTSHYYKFIFISIRTRELLPLKTKKPVFHVLLAQIT